MISILYYKTIYHGRATRKVLLIFLYIMFHAPMGRFQLELIYCFTFIFHRRPIDPLTRWQLEFKPLIIVIVDFIKPTKIQNFKNQQLQ